MSLQRALEWASNFNFIINNIRDVILQNPDPDKERNEKNEEIMQRKGLSPEAYFRLYCPFWYVI